MPFDYCNLRGLDKQSTDNKKIGNRSKKVNQWNLRSVLTNKTISKTIYSYNLQVYILYRLLIFNSRQPYG